MDSVTATRIKILLFAVEKLNERYLGDQFQEYVEELNCTIRMIIATYDDELHIESSGKLVLESFISCYHLELEFEEYSLWLENSEDGDELPDWFGCNNNLINHSDSISDDDLPF
jgi:hypothetical protein